MHSSRLHFHVQANCQHTLHLWCSSSSSSNGRVMQQNTALAYCGAASSQEHNCDACLQEVQTLQPCQKILSHALLLRKCSNTSTSLYAPGRLWELLLLLLLLLVLLLVEVLSELLGMLPLGCSTSLPVCCCSAWLLLLALLISPEPCRACSGLQINVPSIHPNCQRSTPSNLWCSLTLFQLARNSAGA